MKYFIMLLFVTCCVSCLSKKSSHSIAIRKNIDTNAIKLIDEFKFYQLIKESKPPLKLVAIYTSTCGGTPYLFQLINELTTRYSDSLEVILCSSDFTNDRSLTLKTLSEHAVRISPVYLIDREKYMERISDPRRKGYKFRNEICPECKEMVIGVPFKILMDSKGNVLSKGYTTKDELIVAIESFLSTRTK